MSYTYKDNTDEVLSALKMAKKNGLTAIGLTAEGHAPVGLELEVFGNRSGVLGTDGSN